jgi:Uma2 family endonuclease
MSTAAVKSYSVEEYLAIERASPEIKHEYDGGEIFVKSGLNSSHNLIVVNLLGELGSRLRSSDALVYPTGMRILTPSGLYAYPDGSVVCGGPKFAEDRNDTLLNPLIIVEVLSPTTAAYDRGRKFKHYQTIGSLREYVLVEQDQASIDHIARQNDGRWLITSLTGLDGALALPALDLSVPMAEIYAKVEFPPEASVAEGITKGAPTR